MIELTEAVSWHRMPNRTNDSVVTTISQSKLAVRCCGSRYLTGIPAWPRSYTTKRTRARGPELQYGSLTAVLPGRLSVRGVA